MSIADPMIGKKFGRLVVEQYVGLDLHRRKIYKCLCDCGNTANVCGIYLRNGKTKSCGCLLNEYLENGANTTHGMSRSKLYRIWAGMKDRCKNPKTKNYKNYGGRGIKVCDEWETSFQTFYDWAISHNYKLGLSIDRINNDGNYEPNNCRWATHTEQCNNTRRTRLITACGITLSIAEWARKFNIISPTINSYVKKHNISYEKYMELRMQGKIHK